LLRVHAAYHSLQWKQAISAPLVFLLLMLCVRCPFAGLASSCCEPLAVFYLLPQRRLFDSVFALAFFKSLS
jgi:hypothetical protein